MILMEKQLFADSANGQSRHRSNILLKCRMTLKATNKVKFNLRAMTELRQEANVTYRQESTGTKVKKVFCHQYQMRNNCNLNLEETTNN